MSPLVWLAWRLPDNVQVLISLNGHVKRNVRRTVWGWIKWRVTR